MMFEDLQQRKNDQSFAMHKHKFLEQVTSASLTMSEAEMKFSR
jgi:hypothetical protein